MFRNLPAYVTRGSSLDASPAPAAAGPLLRHAEKMTKPRAAARRAANTTAPTGAARGGCTPLQSFDGGGHAARAAASTAGSESLETWLVRRRSITQAGE